MADEEDDYLSDKFLASLSEAAPSRPLTYAEKRKQAQKASHLKNEQNKLKTRRARELEAREEGLGTSLIQRAQEETAESGKQNKALAMMMKMGFQPGQSLGTGPADSSPAAVAPSPPRDAEGPQSPSASAEPSHNRLHRIEPIAIKEWSGKKGIGGVKRPPSPSVLERVRKAAKQTEEMNSGDFRDRARLEYEERRTEGRLRHSQSTCHTLDTKEGIEFSPMWLNPTNPDSFPPGLLDALQDVWTPAVPITYSQERGDPIEARLRSQMQADALQPLSDTNSTSLIEESKHWSHETLAEVTEFLQMDAPDRLLSVLQYLRSKYSYCFWCGAQYSSAQEMTEQCPGSTEDEHD